MKTTSSGAFWIAQTCCMWYSHHKRHPRKWSQMGTRELYMCSMVRDDPIHYTYVYQVLIRVLITEIQFSYLEASEKQRDSEKLPRAARPDRRRKHTCSTFGAFQLDGNIGAGRRMAVAKGIGATLPRRHMRAASSRKTLFWG